MSWALRVLGASCSGTAVVLVGVVVRPILSFLVKPARRYRAGSPLTAQPHLVEAIECKRQPWCRFASGCFTDGSPSGWKFHLSGRSVVPIQKVRCSGSRAHPQLRPLSRPRDSNDGGALKVGWSKVNAVSDSNRPNSRVTVPASYSPFFAIKVPTRANLCKLHGCLGEQRHLSSAG